MILVSCSTPAIRYYRVSPSPDTSMIYFKAASIEGEKITPYLDGLVIDRVSMALIQYGIPATETVHLIAKEYMAMAIGYPITDMDMRVCDSKNNLIVWDTAIDKAAGVSFKAVPGPHIFLLDSPNMSEVQGMYYFILAHKP